MSLPPAFLKVPLAHRGYHDQSVGRIENSLGAARAAIDAGYGIECDVQLTADDGAVVFHDYELMRLTGRSRMIQSLTLAEARSTQLTGSDEAIPPLSALLDIVAGRVPLLIEIKDQHGKLGVVNARLEAAVAEALKTYSGPVAVMSFNPHSVAEMARLAPEVPRGLTTSAYEGESWEPIPAATRDRLREIPDYDRVGACFISHEARDLTRPRVAELKAQGASVLCWTIRSPEAEAEARKIADNITFESYPAPMTWQS